MYKNISLSVPTDLRDIYILYRSNDWNDPSSARLLAATTSKDTLCAIIASEILYCRMSYYAATGKAGVTKFRNDYMCDRVRFKRIDGGIVREARNEQLLSHSTLTDYFYFYSLLNMDDESFCRAFEQQPDLRLKA